MSVTALRRRLRTERGFTLIELMVALTVGSVIVLAAFAMLDRSILLTGRVSDRVDSSQRGRLAMEDMARQLRSPACLATGGVSIVDAQDYSVTFYTFLGAATAAYAPQMRTLRWDNNTNALLEDRYAGTTLPATPTSTRTITRDVVPRPQADPETGATPTPLFKYYRFTSAGRVEPTVRLNTPLSVADRRNVVSINLNFVARVSGRSNNRQSTAMQTNVYMRTSDPNAEPTPSGPQCL
jgi:prepilin-type N-terminal cleavage/methylation domain-containing protein